MPTISQRCWLSRCKAGIRTFSRASFCDEIRKITEESGAALIFDEVVTGFRVHPGGCQALFGIRADLATYGKVVAGGMPIGCSPAKPRSWTRSMVGVAAWRRLLSGSWRDVLRGNIYPSPADTGRR